MKVSGVSINRMKVKPVMKTGRGLVKTINRNPVKTIGVKARNKVASKPAGYYNTPRYTKFPTKMSVDGKTVKVDIVQPVVERTIAKPKKGAVYRKNWAVKKVASKGVKSVKPKVIKPKKVAK